MGKKRSAVILVLLTLLIVVMGFFCVVSFPYADGMHTFNTVVAVTDKDATLGGTLADGQTYVGGGYSAIYYPEGVISSKRYENDLSVITDENDRTEYENKYVSYGALYLEREKACDRNGAVTEEFKASFENAVSAVRARYDAYHADGARVDVQDDYSIRVFLPANASRQYGVFTAFARTGEFSISFGADANSAAKIMPESRRGKTIRDYVTGASTRTAADGTVFIQINFTEEGREALRTRTATLSNSTSNDEDIYLFFCVGDEQVISLPVDSPLDSNVLYVNGGGMTGETARATAILIDSALNGSENDLELSMGDVYRHGASFGDDALLLAYIALGVCFVAMMIFFFARYGLLGFAHLYSYLLFIFAMFYCIWAIPFLYFGVGTIVALILASVVISVTNAVAYEYARREYATGKTMASSVATGYKKCFWALFDMHVILALFAFVTYGISLTALSAFAFTFGLAIVFGGISSLAIGRLCWATMMAFTKKKGAFCRFKREEVEDD